MVVTYKSKRIEEVCRIKEKMDDFFDHDKSLVINLQILIDLIDLESNIFNFKKPYYKGYNFEKCEGTKNKYSLRIIPKKRKSNYRMFLEPTDGGVEIEIVSINRHKYKFK